MGARPPWVIHARVEGFFLNLYFRVDIRYRAVETEARISVFCP